MGAGRKMKWNELLSPRRVRDFFETSGKRKGDHRSEFERDYDRAIFCTPVRRLHDKTQVFPLEPNDSVRTRLTHSLEVSTVARDMARAIGRWLEDKREIDEDQERHIETIAATCGLIHDLGNPPFGHAGEESIREWFKAKGDGFCDCSEQLKNDFLLFEGNAQTLRLVSKLQVLADLYGLNFTCATMSALRKYVVASDGIDKRIHEKKKTGHFASEELLVDLIRHETQTGDARNPITFIVEAADDIVYSAVDLEDGIKKGVVSWKILKDELRREFNAAKSKMEEKKHVDEDMAAALENCFTNATKMLEKKPPGVGFPGSSSDEAMAQAFRVYAIGLSVEAAIDTFENRYDEIMAGRYHGELFEDSSAVLLIKSCKKVGERHVYSAKQNLKLEIMGRRIIHDLMDVFWEGVSMSENGGRFPGKIYSLISENYRTVFDYSQKPTKVLPEYDDVLKMTRNKQLPKNYSCIQLMTDYICGMTDTFASTLHKRLTNG